MDGGAIISNDSGHEGALETSALEKKQSQASSASKKPNLIIPLEKLKHFEDDQSPIE
jgi:hypothetical protein